MVLKNTMLILRCQTNRIYCLYCRTKQIFIKCKFFKGYSKCKKDYTEIEKIAHFETRCADYFFFLIFFHTKNVTLREVSYLNIQDNHILLTFLNCPASCAFSGS